MTDKQFQSLIDSYLKNKISKLDKGVLKNIIAADPYRNKLFEEACRGSQSHSKSTHKSSRRRKSRSSKKSSSSGSNPVSNNVTKRVSDRQLLLHAIRVGFQKFIHVRLKENYWKYLLLVTLSIIAMIAFYNAVSYLVSSDDEHVASNIVQDVGSDLKVFGAKESFSSISKHHTYGDSFSTIDVLGVEGASPEKEGAEDVQNGSNGFKYKDYEYKFDYDNKPVLGDPIIYNK